MNLGKLCSFFSNVTLFTVRVSEELGGIDVFVSTSTDQNELGTKAIL